MTRGQSLYDWCMENGEFGSKILKEWTGLCEDGTVYNVADISKGTKKKFLWCCIDGHEWFAQVANRTNLKQSCPKCALSTVREEKSLYTWCMANSNFGHMLINEFTGIGIDGKKYNIKDIARATNKKILWRCFKGHEWYASVNSRTCQRTGCPHCYDINRGTLNLKQVPTVGTNDLETWCRSNVFGETIIREWTGICIDGNTYSKDTVTCKSNKKCYGDALKVTNGIKQYHIEQLERGYVQYVIKLISVIN